MRAIYPYKIIDRENPPHIKNPDWLEVCKISLQEARKFYTTVLVADTYTAEYFNSLNLHFDKVEISKSIENYHGGIYSVPKMLAMIEQEVPYVMVDTDSIIFQPVERTEQIMFGHPEVNFLEWYPAVYENTLRYVTDHYLDREALDKVKERIPPQVILDFAQIPNNSLVYCENPEILRTAYTAIMEDLKDVIEELPPTYPEQLLILPYIEYQRNSGLYHCSKPTWIQDHAGMHVSAKYDKPLIYSHLPKWENYSISNPLVNVLRNYFIMNKVGN